MTTNNKYVMRFYGNIDYALECIALKQIKFIHIDKLNDPFDPLFDFSTDFNNEYKQLLEYVTNYHPKDIKAFVTKLPENAWKESFNTWLQFAKDTKSKMFLFSACEVNDKENPRDNLYMWSHYAKGHRGVAIEFDKTILETSLGKNDNGNESKWFKIHYTDEIPKITCEDIFEFVINATPDASNLESYGPKLSLKIRQQVKSKAIIWKNENECRLAIENNETRLKIYTHQLPDYAITTVYLGCRLEDNEKVQKDFLYETERQFPNACVYIAKKEFGKFGLKFDLVNY